MDVRVNLALVASLFVVWPVPQRDQTNLTLSDLYNIRGDGVVSSDYYDLIRLSSKSEQLVLDESPNLFVQRIEIGVD